LLMTKRTARPISIFEVTSDILLKGPCKSGGSGQ
jgi:hypothetical protein